MELRIAVAGRVVLGSAPAPGFGTRADEMIPLRRGESRRDELMERGMGSSAERFVPTEDAEVVALDWGSLGQLVRRRTLDAVAMHFADVGLGELSESETQRGLEPAAQVG